MYGGNIYTGQPRSGIGRLLYSGSGAPGTYNPVDSGALATWIDAMEYGTLLDGSDAVAADNVQVKTATDRSGAGNHMTNATSDQQPKYKASAINGRPALWFYWNSVFTVLSAADASSLNYTTFYMAIAFQRQIDLNITETIGGKYAITTPANQREFRMAINGTNEKLFAPNSINGSADTASFAGIDTVATATPYIGECWFDGTNINTRISTGATGSGATGGAIFQGTAPLTLGCRDSGAEPFAGYIGEMRFFTSQLTAAARNVNQADMAAKWGIAL